MSTIWKNIEERQNLLRERWTEVTRDRIPVCVCASVLTRWKNTFNFYKQSIWDLAYWQTVWNYVQSIRGGPAPFYRYTNLPCAHRSCTWKTQIRNTCISNYMLCHLVLERFFQDVTVPRSNIPDIAYISGAAPFLHKKINTVMPEPVLWVRKIKAHIVASIPNFFPRLSPSHSQGVSQGTSLKRLYTNRCCKT